MSFITFHTLYCCRPVYSAHTEFITTGRLRSHSIGECPSTNLSSRSDAIESYLVARTRTTVRTTIRHGYLYVQLYSVDETKCTAHTRARLLATEDNLFYLIINSQLCIDRFRWSVNERKTRCRHCDFGQCNSHTTSRIANCRIL